MNFGVSKGIKNEIKKKKTIVNSAFVDAIEEISKDVKYSEGEATRLEAIKKAREIVNNDQESADNLLDDDIIELLAKLEFEDFIKYIKSKDYSIGEGRAGRVYVFNKGKNGIVLPSIFCYKITRHNNNQEINKASMEEMYLSQLNPIKGEIISEIRMLFSEYKKKLLNEPDDVKWDKMRQISNLPCFKNLDSFEFCPAPLEFAEGVEGLDEDEDYLFMERIKGLSIEEFTITISRLLYLEETNQYQEVNKLMREKGITIDLLKDFFQNDTSIRVFEYVLNKMIKVMHEKSVCHRDLYARNIMINFDNLLPTFVDFGEAGFMFNGGNTEDDPYSYTATRRVLILEKGHHQKEEYVISQLKQDRIKELKSQGAKETTKMFAMKASPDESAAMSSLTKLKECVINNGKQFLELLSNRQGGDAL